MFASDLDEDYSNRNPKNMFRSVGLNTGNVAFVHAIKKLIKLENGNATWDSAENVKSDAVVFAAANQLGKHTDLGGLASSMEKSGVPIVVIGLGTQTPQQDQFPELSPGTQLWLETMLKMRPTANSNIWTRGEYSADQIRRFVPDSDPVIGCCPSLFISSSIELGKQLKNTQSDFRRVAVAAGHPGMHAMREIECQLTSLVSDVYATGRYIPQSPEEMIALGLGNFETLKPESITHLNEFIAPSLSHTDFINWCKTYARAFFDAKSWMLELSHFDVVVGARYHGVALGMQAGVPGIVIDIDGRTHELGISTRIPMFKPRDATDISRSYLKKIWDEFDPVMYDLNRIDLARRFLKFLTDNLLEPTDHLKKLADSNA